MREFLDSPEKFKPGFMVISDENRKVAVKKMLDAKRAVGFIVTNDFEIYLSKNGEHRHIIAEQANPSLNRKRQSFA